MLRHARFLLPFPLIAACMALSACSASGSSATASVMPAASELPGDGWKVVANNDFRQFDPPKDLSKVQDGCQDAAALLAPLQELAKERGSRSVRMIRSSLEMESVQVTVYAQEFKDAAAREAYFKAWTASDTAPETLSCFESAMSGEGTSASVVSAEPRVAASSGTAFAREARYTLPAGEFRQRFEGYSWIDGDLVIQVQFVGPPEELSAELIAEVKAIVVGKLKG